MYQYQFANNLCRFCKEKNISTDELAERIGKSSRQVSRYRNGNCKNITLATIVKISNALQIQISELLE